ncbi:MAG: ribosome-associated ATPase/putative transporter RbbA [Arcobacteraceae bacterium]|nr:ribosome-associated ATPase/putative transporter RbbA [Arcobacteraceae bacterium]
MTNKEDSSLICIKNLSFSYSEIMALENIDVTIPANSMTALVGPDGVGKSTLLSLLAGVRKIQTGTIEVFNNDISKKTVREENYSRIAYMPQGLGKNLYMTLSVYENIDFFGRLFGQDKQERKARIESLLKSTGLYAFQTRPAGKLSGGMKQKLGLCCALIHDPELLILDEPTTGIDPLSRKQFWELIREIKKVQHNMSVLIATSYMQEAQEFDYIIAMNRGKILAYDTPKALLEKTHTQSIDDMFITLVDEKVKEIRVSKKPITPLTSSINFAIEAKSLSMKFGEFTAVNSVDFQIQQGEIFGFLGSNGCGKSTTMKMLTGLLTPSDGSIKLFGKSIQQNSLDIRKHVGYMTQSFSLYNELTIKENMVLHAHLYQIAQNKVALRVEEMLEYFKLKAYEHRLTNDLPLGLKQRLSLAVAVIHKPKMLILDEPTSGVDPLSRDIFWEFLIDLARKEEVTIFVSTHFMNEGERCDRISLMHQGKVLVTNTPQNIIASKYKNNLEEAFIEYLNEEMTDANISYKEIKQEQSSQKYQNSFFSMVRFWGYAYREYLELIRDPIRLTFALLGTVILMFVIGYGINLDVKDMRFSVLDYDQSPQSREYIANISGSRYFLEQEPLFSPKEIDETMRQAKVSIVYEIPPHFGHNLQKGLNVEIGVWIDGTLPFRAETMRGYILGNHQQYLSTLSYPQKTSLVNIQMRYRYNQDFKSIVAMIPAIIPMLLIFIPAILMAVSVVREKELGSISNFYSTPVTKLEFLLGKQLPYVVISMISFLGLVVLAVYVFEVPLKGNFILFCWAALLYIIATTGLGMLFSAFAKTQIAALGTTAILTLLPTINFSGLKEPVSSLEGVGVWLGSIFPASYFITISRGIFTKDVGFEGLKSEFISLGVLIIGITVLSLFFLKKQEK